MRVHRTARERFFTTLGNEVLRDNRLSFCARGILAHMLSQPDGTRIDIRTLTDRTPEGRERVAGAMRELERFGYLKRTTRRTPEGRIFTDVEVFDTLDGPPQPPTPHTGFPGSDDLSTDSDGDKIFKKQEEETKPSHPVLAVADNVDADVDAGDGREGVVGDDTDDDDPAGNDDAAADIVDTPADNDDSGAGAGAGAVADVGDEETQSSADLLARVARMEPKLSLGRGEALRLAPLVIEWRRRGASDLHVIASLTAGLPRDGVHHPVRFLETRLVSKMPAARSATPVGLECDQCGVPVRTAGLCRSCRAVVEPVDSRAGTDFDQSRVRGIALARQRLRAGSLGSLMPFPT